MKRQLLFTVVISFAAGFAVCWIARGNPEPAQPGKVPEILFEPITVHKGGVGHTLKPYQVQATGRVALDEQPSDPGSPKWALQFGGGRVWVFCEQLD